MARNSELNALHLAVMQRSMAAVVQALSSGEDIDLLDREHRSPLFYAVKNGGADIVKELIGRGANVTLRDNNGETPLHFAAREYQIEIARILIGSGAEVDAQDAYGNTPLGRAVFSCNNRGEMIKLLLLAGADRHLRNISGVSPSSLAEKIANFDAKQFLD